MRELPLAYSFRAFRVLLLLLPVYLSSQTLTVLDENDQALIGVEVYSKDYQYGEVTDEHGQVSLDGLTQEDIITLRYLGYQTITDRVSFFAENAYSISLFIDESLLEELVVLGRKTVEASDIPYQVQSISIKDIQSQEAQTSADALAQQGGVYVQKSQLGGGSPVIRGFEASRVLLVVDDIRLNNAIYRSGHLQNAITIDQAVLERVDVIYGPNSLSYGSDALGGVVNFKTRNPTLADGPGLTTVGGNYYIRYASANEEVSTHVDMSYGRAKWGALTSLTYSSYNDLRTGSVRDERFPDFGKRLTFQGITTSREDVQFTNPDPNIQVGSGYNQLDLLHKILYTPNLNNRITANIQFSTSSNVPRYDNLSEVVDGQLRWAEWDFGPQNRFLAALDYRHIAHTKFYDQLTVIGSYQRIDEDRLTRRFGNPIREEQNEDVFVLSLTADATKNVGDQFELSYGADVQYNDVISSVNNFNVTSFEFVDIPALTRYASGDNRLTYLGAYVSGVLKSKEENHHLNGGIRYTQTSYRLSYDRDDPIDWPANFFEGIKGSNDAITLSLGSSHQLNEKLLFKALVGTAFRSPNIDDLAKIRINADEITFPNLDLNPERSTNAEITIGYNPSKSLRLSTTAFYTRLSDAIVRRSFTTPDGSSIFVSQGDILQVVGNQNVQNARIQGVSVNVAGDISKKLSYFGSFNATSGKELNQGEASTPLAHIPPVYGQAGVKFEDLKYSLRAIYRYNGFKSIDDFGGSVDNPDLATPIGSLAWSTFNVYGSYHINSGLSISLSLENIADKHYRPFASGISAPGRNVVVSIRGKI